MAKNQSVANATIAQLSSIASATLAEIRANVRHISETLRPQGLTVRNALEIIDQRCFELEHDIQQAKDDRTDLDAEVMRLLQRLDITTQRLIAAETALAAAHKPTRLKRRVTVSTY